MTTKEILSIENDYFSSSLHNDILIVRQKQHILHMAQYLGDIFSMYEYMNNVLSSDSYRAFVMFVRPEQNGYVEHSRFLSRILSGGRESKDLDRFLNVVNRIFLMLSLLNRMTVFAGRGTISLFYLNIGLAHDYRLVAEDTVFENLNADVGLITKGSGYFLPHFLGVRKTTEVLQWKNFSAEEALQLGLVDQVVPVSTLEEDTMQLLRHPVHSPATLPGIRRLLRCDIEELKRSLDLEDHLIKERLKSEEFKEAFATNREHLIKSSGV